MRKLQITNIKYQIFLRGFTLIELLVVISIIGILIGLSIFGLQGARKSARDAVRKGDLEQIRSGLAMYKSDCDFYPLSLDLTSLTTLVGTGLGGNCSDTNSYISKIPADPVPGNNYVYAGCSLDGSKYLVCAALENNSVSNIESITCNEGTTIQCGSCGENPCNYQVTNP